MGLIESRRARVVSEGEKKPVENWGTNFIHFPEEFTST